MQLSVIQFTIKMFHISEKSCVTWQGIDYKPPDDDKIVSKHVAV